MLHVPGPDTDHDGGLGVISALLAVFGGLIDLRSGRGIRHELASVPAFPCPAKRNSSTAPTSWGEGGRYRRSSVQVGINVSLPGAFATHSQK